ncbi:MAG: hypothetical protein JXR70_18270 [Spirochaetales bacterium]|nr:hypothetical protein [Spirochaetales bacterium]
MKKTNQFSKLGFLVLLLLFSTTLMFAAVCGDVNSDGKVTIVDALLTAQRYVGIKAPVFDESVADVNGDSVINIVDALLMAKFYVGLEKELTGCKSGEANLVPAQFKGPSSSTPGGIVGADLSLNVMNKGAGAAVNSVGYIFVGFYLSKNNTWDSSDTLLTGGRESVATPFAPGETKAVTILDGMTIPSGTAPGNYYLLAVVDEQKSVSESNENDNVLALPITIAGNAKIIIFDAGGKTGALGGRSGADLLCSTYVGMQSWLAGKKTRALISVDASDEIRDMPSKYGVPTNLPIVSVSGKKIADNWADLLDGSIGMTLQDAEILSYQFWYSGSNADGSLNECNCTNWTSANGYLDGRYGRWLYTDANWISLGNATCGANTYHILGLAWE